MLTTKKPYLWLQFCFFNNAVYICTHSVVKSPSTDRRYDSVFKSVIYSHLIGC